MNWLSLLAPTCKSAAGCSSGKTTMPLPMVAYMLTWLSVACGQAARNSATAAAQSNANGPDGVAEVAIDGNTLTSCTSPRWRWQENGMSTPMANAVAMDSGVLVYHAHDGVPWPESLDLFNGNLDSIGHLALAEQSVTSWAICPSSSGFVLGASIGDAKSGDLGNLAVAHLDPTLKMVEPFVPLVDTATNEPTRGTFLFGLRAYDGSCILLLRRQGSNQRQLLLASPQGVLQPPVALPVDGTVLGDDRTAPIPTATAVLTGLALSEENVVLLGGWSQSPTADPANPSWNSTTTYGWVARLKVGPSGPVMTSVRAPLVPYEMFEHSDGGLLIVRESCLAHMTQQGQLMWSFCSEKTSDTSYGHYVPQSKDFGYFLHQSGKPWTNPMILTAVDAVGNRVWSKSLGRLTVDLPRPAPIGNRWATWQLASWGSFPKNFHITTVYAADSWFNMDCTISGPCFDKSWSDCLDDNPCTADLCDAAHGGCYHVDLSDGATCTAGGKACKAGKCK